MNFGKIFELLFLNTRKIFSRYRIDSVAIRHSRLKNGFKHQQHKHTLFQDNSQKLLNADVLTCPIIHVIICVIMNRLSDKLS